MFKNIKVKIVALLGVAMLLTPIAATVPTFAQNVDKNLCNGANLDLTDGGTCTKTTQTGTDSLNNLVHTIINIFSLVVGIVSVIMIIVGGFRYVTSGGASDSVSGAKNTIIYAIIGLVVVALAQFIVQFVLNKVTNAGN